MNSEQTDEAFLAEGYTRALALLRECSSEDGFLASPSQHDNYRRVWARDGVIMGLAALMTGDRELAGSFRHTLLTLARYQGPHGEIPSNVDSVAGRVSYGGTTGRVDADLWFIIGCCQYWQATGDDEFLPLPDYAVSDVGTIIYEIRGGQWCPLKEWAASVTPTRHQVRCDSLLDETHSV